MQKDDNYKIPDHIPEHFILERAAEILERKYLRFETFSDAKSTMKFLSFKLGKYEQEVFAVLLLDNQHQLIEFKEMFKGTVDSASVYPREIVKVALLANASAVIFAHNHPSGISTPSEADKRITARLTQSLALIDVRVLDHIVVGQKCTSFAEKGLI
ncbi:DNA repair protein RadC [Vibrio aestuarianus]|uniref:RadC family protein n=1 Tax=Vibrio aestuarianus TaxID=28171 RepID=UPI00237D1232|nr:DNA repair protein RadC [Vibrio aestuarianus]MDE1348528.1 DNA repair protein RadC [Vibrio aestuarianus]